MSATASHGEAVWNLPVDWERAQESSGGAIDPVYRERRSQCPVQRIRLANGNETWAVIGQSEVTTVLMDTVTFSSAQYLMGPELLIPIELDPPQHGSFRRVLNRLISSRTAVALEPTVRSHAESLLKPFVMAGGGDLRPLANELTLRTLCALLGVSDQEWQVVHESQSALTASDIAKVDVGTVAARFAGIRPMMDYAQTLIDRKRVQPGEDLVSGLLAAEIDDRRLTDKEILQIMVLMLMAGHETTRTAIEGSTLLLASHREVQQRLRADFSLIPGAIEECLRVEAPVQALNRKAVKDVELAGRRIAAGDQVMPVYGAANFDPEAFSCPATFDIDRKVNRHFTFGRGIHTCVGAPIARMELRVFWEEMLSRTSEIRFVGRVDREMWPDSTLRSLRIEVESA
jgi:cytochrome P450